MSTHVQGFQSYFSFFAAFCIVKLATSSIRVNHKYGSLDTQPAGPYVDKYTCELGILRKFVGNLLYDVDDTIS